MCTVCTRILFDLVLYFVMISTIVPFVDGHYENRRRPTKTYFTPTSDYETITDEYDKAHTPYNFEKNQDYRLHDLRISPADDYEETDEQEDSPEQITLKTWDDVNNVRNDYEDERNVEGSRHSKDFVYRELDSMSHSGAAERDYEYDETSQAHPSRTIGARLREPIVTARPVYHADDADSPPSLSRLERLNHRLARPQDDEFNTEQQRHQRQSLYKNNIPDDEQSEYQDRMEKEEISEKNYAIESIEQKLLEKGRRRTSLQNGRRRHRKNRRNYRNKTMGESAQNIESDSSESYLKDKITEARTDNDEQAKGAIVGIAQSEESEWDRLARYSRTCALTADIPFYKITFTLVVVMMIL